MIVEIPRDTDTTRAVSYTHLDVYKRQLQDQPFPLLIGILLIRPSCQDVYKRQIQDKKQEAQLPVPFILNKKIHVLFQTDPGPDTFYIIVSI